MSARRPPRPPPPPPSQSDVMRVLDRLEDSLRDGLEALRSRGDLTDKRLERIEGRIELEVDSRSREAAHQNVQLERFGETAQRALAEVMALKAGIAEAGTEQYRAAAEGGAAGAASGVVTSMTEGLGSRLVKPRLTIAALALGGISMLAWLADVGPKVLKAIAAFWKLSGSADV